MPKRPLTPCLLFGGACPLQGFRVWGLGLGVWGLGYPKPGHFQPQGSPAARLLQDMAALEGTDPDDPRRADTCDKCQDHGWLSAGDPHSMSLQVGCAECECVCVCVCGWGGKDLIQALNAGEAGPAPVAKDEA